MNTIGRNIRLTIFGESHGEYIGGTLDNIPPGIEIDEEFIEHELMLRRPYGRISTGRVEKDKYKFISGVFNGKTTGAPLTVIIPNENTKSKDYSKTYGIARPGHADYTAYVKYNGFEDYRGGGHFSGRVTTPIVLLGSILKKELWKKDIHIGTHIKELGGIKDENLEVELQSYKHGRNLAEYDILEYNRILKEKIRVLSKTNFPVLSIDVKDKMIEMIQKKAEEGDSIGGVLETVIIGVPKGIGEPMFDSIESRISEALFSIPAVKGVMFGDAFKIPNETGSNFNDEFEVVDKNIVTLTNNNSGINGGITNGMPINFKTYVKPTPSIFKSQKSIDFINSTNKELVINGRHDPCIVHRVRAVVDNLIAVILFGEIYG